MKRLTAALPLLLALPFTAAQSACSSDGTAAPRALYERFVSADCADCWSAATFAPSASTAVLDWIAPGARGDEAPLSAAARSDALDRLAAIARTVPSSTDVHMAPMAQRLPGRLRVSLGQAMNDYVGVSASYVGALPPGADSAAGWTVWLALVEAIPAGTEGTPVARNIIRNALKVNWDKRNQLLKTELTNLPSRTRWIERRSMQVAPGANTERLGLVGWLEDAQGQVVAMARADCSAAP